jgi:acyl-CoA thioester hydrolase
MAGAGRGEPMPSFIHRTRVRFVDTDASGRIHFTAMLRYFEAAEQEFLRSLGFGHHELDEDMGFPRVHVECDYRSAIAFDDELEVAVSVKRMGTSSYTLGFVVTNNGVAAAEGGMVVVCTSRRKGRAQPMPEPFRAALVRFAGTA